MGIRAVAGVEAMRANADVAGLIAVLCDESRSGPERRCAAASLGQLRSRRAVEALVSVLDDDAVCAQAVQALAAIGDPLAAAPLAELYAVTASRGIRKLAERALNRLYEQNPNAVRAVLERYERHQAKRNARRKKRR
jgi:HEAT repeat protein